MLCVFDTVKQAGWADAVVEKQEVKQLVIVGSHILSSVMNIKRT